MKKIIFISSALLLCSCLVSAQGLHFGLKGGTDFHKIDGEKFKDNTDIGYHLGAFLEIGLPGKIGVQPEAYFSQVNPKTTANPDPLDFDFGNASHAKLTYLNIPVLLNINVVKVLSVQAGPQFGILMNKDKTLYQNGTEAFKSGDVGIAAGVQLNITKLKIYLRYVAGLNDVSNYSERKWHNQDIHLGIGFRLF